MAPFPAVRVLVLHGVNLADGHRHLYALPRCNIPEFCRRAECHVAAARRVQCASWVSAAISRPARPPTSVPLMRMYCRSGPMWRSSSCHQLLLLPAVDLVLDEAPDLRAVLLHQRRQRLQDLLVDPLPDLAVGLELLAEGAHHRRDALVGHRGRRSADPRPARRGTPATGRRCRSASAGLSSSSSRMRVAPSCASRRRASACSMKPATASSNFLRSS